ncbi:MAG: PqqD family protein [Desulfobacula sp.]|uniref:PqqD family protein n=1 Tax=Desulfobacula sp. TaxID=2593537 RepID=UPI0025C15055|nr:PqqD family protein [Desulfobacula sp.]MCD4720957.1 PqqD family protein [Desulfobacula sp.]
MIYRKKNTLKKKDALLCIPEKNTTVKETYLDSGDLILTYQAMYKPFFLKIQKIIRQNSKKTFTRKIQLDGLGVDVWSLLDGEKNVKAIIKKFATRHTLNYKEAEISVTLFLRSLGEKGLIGIKEP